MTDILTNSVEKQIVSRKMSKNLKINISDQIEIPNNASLYYTFESTQIRGVNLFCVSYSEMCSCKIQAVIFQHNSDIISTTPVNFWGTFKF